jgi:hypothetical protein
MRRALIASAAIMLTLPAGMCVSTKFVTVPCLTKEQLEKRKAAEPKLVGPELTGDAQRDVRIIGGSAKELRAWGRGNLDILGGCVG